MLDTIVVYSHTEFSEVLQIQTDYVLKTGMKLILFINKNDNLYDYYDEVVYYDDDQPYASKLKQCLEQITEYSFLFLHDNDILLNLDTKVLSGISAFMHEYDIDKVDLKQSPYDNKNHIGTVGEVKILVQDNLNHYMYNVNPNLWKRDAFLEIVTTFPGESYRTIENRPVQNFCKKFKFVELMCNNPLYCGYFWSIPFFVFLHITHQRKLLRYNKDCINSQGQSYIDVKEEYKHIVDKYNLRNSTMWENVNV